MLSWITPATAGVGVGLLTDAARSKTELIAENAFLRQQVLVLHRSVKRPLPTPRDRFLLVMLASKVRARKQALRIVQPDALLGWHVTCFAGCGGANQWQQHANPVCRLKRAR